VDTGTWRGPAANKHKLIEETIMVDAT